MKKQIFTSCLFLLILSSWEGSHLLYSSELPYLEPGSLRLSHKLSLEGVFHRVSSGWRVENNGLDKNFSQNSVTSNPWRSEWGQTLVTEAEAQLSEQLFGRIQFEGQGDYADRFWRPNNINHKIEEADRNFFMREAEMKFEADNWYTKGFSGVSQPDWQSHGDLFGLFPNAHGADDYLGGSGFLGISPAGWRQNKFLNVSKRRVPQGFEVGSQFWGVDSAVAYGDELRWGYGPSFYGRMGVPLAGTQLTGAYRDEDVPYLSDIDEDRKRTYALSWSVPQNEGPWLDFGVKYEPFRLGETYKIARRTNTGDGLLGSDWAISEKQTKKSDAWAERIRINQKFPFLSRDWSWTMDLTHAGVAAGNKEEAGTSLGMDITSTLWGQLGYVYRRPVEGPIPFLFEGTPSSLGAVAANPRGPESPFIVDWSNREASYFSSTLIFDPTPGTRLFSYDPTTFESWNINPDEDAPLTVAVQFRLTDYKTTTDRQYYYDREGNILFEPAAHTGAWASNSPLPEIKVFLHGMAPLQWTLGFSAGKSPARLGLAYSTDTSTNKPLTDFYSIEARLEKWPLELWSHYGEGLWGPEVYHHEFGESFDRLWGVGVAYHINTNTTWDVGYVGVRQDDNLFVASDLGSYDEIRTTFSHRFGFLFQFQDAAKPGFKSR